MASNLRCKLRYISLKIFYIQINDEIFSPKTIFFKNVQTGKQQTLNLVYDKLDYEDHPPTHTSRNLQIYNYM
jgi:hypothetical protein